MINYFKKIPFIFLIYLFFFNYANSEILKNIEISGNKRISKETVLVLGNIEIGKDLNSSELNYSLKKLYDTNFFENINYSLNNGLLKIFLVENPIIEEINITGIKKKSFTKQIYEKISLKNRMSYTEEQFKKDIDVINSSLKASGYYFSKIKSSIKRNDDLNSITLNIDIQLGEKAKIKEIIFIGDKKVKDKKLLELIASEEHKFWKFISNRVYLNKSLLDLDKRLLENYYKNNGYYNVKVLNSFAELNDEGSFKIVLI